MPQPKTNEQLVLSDLARPLSLDAIMYFARDDLPKAVGKEHQSTKSGKFVRIGEAMVIGATLSYGKPGYRGDLKTLFHWQLSQYLFNDEELAKLAKATVANEPQINGGLTDAGATFIKLDPDGIPTDLILASSSFDFGKADDAGRARSVEIAQSLVGPSVIVS